jgi:hypothetical protein
MVFKNELEPFGRAGRKFKLALLILKSDLETRNRGNKKTGAELT